MQPFAVITAGGTGPVDLSKLEIESESIDIPKKNNLLDSFETLFNSDEEQPVLAPNIESMQAEYPEDLDALLDRITEAIDRQETVEAPDSDPSSVVQQIDFPDVDLPSDDEQSELEDPVEFEKSSMEIPAPANAIEPDRNAPALASDIDHSRGWQPELVGRRAGGAVDAMDQAPARPGLSQPVWTQAPVEPEIAQPNQPPVRPSEVRPKPLPPEAGVQNVPAAAPGRPLIEQLPPQAKPEGRRAGPSPEPKSPVIARPEAPEKPIEPRLSERAQAVVGSAPIDRRSGGAVSPAPIPPAAMGAGNATNVMNHPVEPRPTQPESVLTRPADRTRFSIERVPPQPAGNMALPKADTNTPTAPATVVSLTANTPQIPVGREVTAPPAIEVDALPEFRASAESPLTARTLGEMPVPKAELPRHISQQLVEMMQRGAGKQVEVHLNPIELGRVKMSLQTVEGSVVVQIAAERPETADLMRRHLDVLAQDFRAIGFSNPQFSFAGNNAQDGATRSEQTGRTSSDDAGATIVEPEQMALPQRILTDRVDIRL